MFKLLFCAFLFTAFLFNSHLYSQEIHNSYLSLSTGISIPTGKDDFTKYYNSGAAFNASYEHNYTKFFTAGLTTFVSYYTISEYNTFSMEFAPTQLLLCRMNVYAKMQDNTGADKLQPFLKAGAGYFVNDKHSDYNSSIKGSGYSLVFGNGANYRVNNNLKLIFEAEYTLYFEKKYPASSVQFMAGIAFNTL